MSTSRLRKFRKSANLTQREMALLVGYASQRAYSDMELGLKRPALGPAIACCMLFEASPYDLFPGFAETVGRDLRARAHKLHEDLAKQAGRESTALILAEIVERLDGLEM